MRAFTWWSLVLMGALCLLPPILDFVKGRMDTPSSLMLFGLAAGTTALRGWFVTRAMRPGQRHRHPNAPALLGMAAMIVAWGYAVATHPSPVWWSFLPALFGGAIVLTQPAKARWWTAGAMIAVTATCGALVAGARDAPPLEPGLAFFSAVLVMSVIITIDVLQLWLWDVTAEVDQARATAGELAVAQERLRFAADLHDIQGHHLQAIVLKGELVERLIGRDDASAREQATELTGLARKALADVREVVHGYRRTSLDTEVANAVEILRAAGVRSEVRGDVAAVPPPLQQLFGLLVREGTTNVLRHSDARRCELVLTTDDTTTHVRLVNDGVSGNPADEGSGLAGLSDRFATLGGQVRARLLEDGYFELQGWVRSD